MITDVISMNCRLASTMTAPEMAPMAAAVTPPLKAFRDGCLVRCGQDGKEVAGQKSGFERWMVDRL